MGERENGGRKIGYKGGRAHDVYRKCKELIQQSKTSSLLICSERDHSSSKHLLKRMIWMTFFYVLKPIAHQL